MNPTRRKFLGLLAAAPIVAPAVARAAAAPRYFSGSSYVSLSGEFLVGEACGESLLTPAQMSGFDALLSAHAAPAGIAQQDHLPEEKVTMSKFRKKPVVIEAVRWRGWSSNLGITSEAPDQPVEITADNMGGIKWDGLPSWLPVCLPPLPTEALTRASVEPGQIRRYEDFLHIGTLEGVMAAAPGDWIIRGIKGEIYPCKPDIFAATYNAAGGQRFAECADGRRPAKRPDGWPTRSDLQWMSPAEIAIRDAMLAVENAGASPALTDAINLLSKARDRVADHVEGAGDTAG